METKTAKILSVIQNHRTYTTEKGICYIHLITFEGDEHNKAWEFHSTNPLCEKFKVNEISIFDFEIKQVGQYTNYKIKPHQDAFQNNKMNPKIQNQMGFLSCLNSAALFHASLPACNWEHVLSATEIAYDKLNKKING